MKRILLVDDEQLTTLALSKMIERSQGDYQIAGTASNGQEALEFLEENEVDIAIVDIRMPILDGIGLMEQIREKDLSVHVIILSAYRDFEYAQKALRFGACDYLLKPVSQNSLMEALDKLSLLVDQEQEAKTAHDLFFYKKRQKAVYALLETGKSDSEHLPELLRSDETGSLLLLTSPQEFPHPFMEDCHDLGWEPYRDFQMVYFLPDRMASEDLVQQIAEAARKLMPNYFLPALSISHSQGGYPVRDLPKALIECKVAAMYAFYFPEKAVINYPDIQLFGQASIRPAVASFEELHSYIRLENYENIIKKLEEIHHSLKVEMSLNPQTLYQLFYEMFIEFRLAEKKRGDTHFFEGITLARLQSFLSLDALFDFAFTLINNYFDGASEVTVSHDEQIVERVKEYCMQNYAADCTLDDMAAAVYISKSYLSQIFKEQCGVSIWNYFTKLRIEKAKELLVSNKIKVNQVGEMVGFKNASHFGRIFKNHVGVSPKEYRQKISPLDQANPDVIN